MAESGIQFCTRCAKPVSQPTHVAGELPKRPVHVGTGREEC
jgi:hypothetical protein